MKPTNMTIHEVFEKERRYTVPLFQRAFVWTLEGQWEPLWEDIERQARSCLVALSQNQQVTTSHFLGAVVFNGAKVLGRGLARAEVIDGQQRLTTLQVFLAALRDLAKAADDQVAPDAQRLTLNPGPWRRIGRTVQGVADKCRSRSLQNGDDRGFRPSHTGRDRHEAGWEQGSAS